jgi:hypothetical protein
MTTMMDHALAYARRGLPVFPCWTVLPNLTNTGFICACGRAACGNNTGKHPLGSIAHSGVSDASTDLEKVRHWWTLKPDANIGLATGSVIVLDVDPRHGGDKSLAELEDKFGPLPKTRRARTGGGGEHIYFRPPANASIRNSAGDLAPGLDIRTSGGYVMAPPSRHMSGRYYEWLDNIPSAEIPSWLIDKLQEKPIKQAAAPEHWRRLVSEGVSEGRRDDSITALAGHLLRRYVDPHVVLDLLTVWNDARCRPPLPHSEVHRAVTSICRKEFERRNDH